MMVMMLRMMGDGWWMMVGDVDDDGWWMMNDGW